MPAKYDALITFGWCRSSYTALRSLRRLGLRVAVADTSRVGMCQWSRFGEYAGRYAPFLTEPEAYVGDVVRLLDLTAAKFLLPGHDDTEVLARYRARLPDQVLLPVASHHQLELANNKARMAELAADIGLPVPKVIQWTSFEDLERNLKIVSKPLVVKLRRGNSAKGVFYPASNKEAVQLCHALVEEFDLPPNRYPIVQDRVLGEGWGVSCLYWRGSRIASFTHRRLREKTPTGGTSTLRISARNTKLEEYAHRLLDAMNWHGLAMVEFRYSPTSEQAWFIEVNPRLWGSIHLAVAAGVDFPALLYYAATEGPEMARRFVRPWRSGIVARWYLGDAIVAAGELAHGRLFSAFRLLLPGGSHTIDDWQWDDPGAFMGQAMNYLATFLRMRSLNPVQEGDLG